jgi:integrase
MATICFRPASGERQAVVTQPGNGMPDRRVNLTKRVVDAAKAAANDYQIWDAKVRGFGVRVYPSGVKAFILQYRNAAGRTRKIVLGRYGIVTADMAREKAIKLLGAVFDGRDPSQDKRESRKAQTVGELADLYLSEGSIEKPNKKPSSWETDRSIIKRHIRPLLGARLARGLTPLDVARFQADVASGKTATDERTGPRGRAIVTGGMGIASRALSVLSAMMTFGQRRGIVTDNPTNSVEPFRGQKKERFLTDTEVAILGQAIVEMERDASLPWVASAAIKLLLLTGARRGEILGLRWEDVDLDRGCLRLKDSKTGAKVIRLANAALSLLVTLPRSSGWVLPAAKGSGHYIGLPKHWNAVRARANEIAASWPQRHDRFWDGIPSFGDVRLHDLRHSFASFAVQSGGSLFLIGKVLGHRQARTTERYAHTSDEPLLATAELAARRIELALDGTKKGSGVSGTKRGSEVGSSVAGGAVTRSQTGQVHRARRRTGLPR